MARGRMLEFAFLDEFSAAAEGVRMVYAESFDRGATDRSEAGERCATPSEMVRPTIRSWMK